MPAWKINSMYTISNILCCPAWPTSGAIRIRTSVWRIRFSNVRDSPVKLVVIELLPTAEGEFIEVAVDRLTF